MGTDMFEYNDNDIDSEENEGGQLLNGNYDEKTSAASFQQALMQWRQGDKKNKKSFENKRLKKNSSTHEAAVDTINGKINQIIIPNIEFNSSKLTYGEKLLLKKYRRSNKNHQEFFNQRIPSTNKTTDIHINSSLPQNDSNIEIEVCFNFNRSYFVFIRLFSLFIMIYQQYEQKTRYLFIRLIVLEQ